jgi:uncharacterized RDD family membrane protein YckC
LSYPSRLFGKIHFLLLAILLLFSICIFINQLGYDLSYDFYYDYLSAFDQVIIAFQDDFFIVTNISFLFWMLRVHTALRRIEPHYPINELEYMLRMLPVIQFWGIASTFNQMSKFFAKHPFIAKRAVRIKVMIPFIYILYFGTIILNLVTDAGWGGILATYISLFGYIIMFIVFILTTYWVNQYLYTCVLDAPEPLLSPILINSTSEFRFESTTAPTQLTPDVIQPHFVQANVWSRLAAKAIEFAIFVIISIAAIIPGAMNDNGGQMILYVAITSLIWVIYLAIHLSINGQTIGKWLMKVKIVRADTGVEGGFIHNFLLRTCVNYIICSFVPFYSLADLLFIFSKEARCIHDRLASTQVIRIHR